MQGLQLAIQNLGIMDVLDILLVTLFFYALFLMLRYTRSFVALMGFVLVIFLSLSLYLIARSFDLKAMILIFQFFWIFIILVFLIIFQNEFRKVMTDIGRMKFFRSFFPAREREAVDELIEAIMAMSARHTGALIAIERRHPLDSYTERGIEVEARVSSELIRTIFTSLTPLHDGAIVIRGDTLVAAKCILGLSDDPELSHALGTRHRAAIGLSEETDAVVLVVSEETGVVSICVDGQLKRGLSREDLAHHLERELDLEAVEESKAGNPNA